MTQASADLRLCESELCPDALLAAQEAAFARDMERLRARQDEFVSVSCPACRCPDAIAAFTKDSFEFVRCVSCRMVYMSPRPSPAVMDAYYSSSENYRFWATHIFPASESARRDKVSAPRLARLRELIRKQRVPGPMTLVEIGPGFGTFASLAQQSGAFEHVLVIERTPEMAHACRAHGLRVLEQDIESPLPGGIQAHVLAAFEVIEHVFEPRVMVQRCFEMLAPGGLLALTCPNVDGFDVTYLGAASLAVDAEHVNLFNPLGLRRLLESCGFEVIEQTTPGRLDVEFVHRAIVSGAAPMPSDPFLRRVLVDEYATLGWPFQQFLASNGLSSHLWCVAQKPADQRARITERDRS